MEKVGAEGHVNRLFGASSERTYRNTRSTSREALDLGLKELLPELARKIISGRCFTEVRHDKLARYLPAGVDFGQSPFGVWAWFSRRSHSSDLSTCLVPQINSLGKVVAAGDFLYILNSIRQAMVQSNGLDLND